MMKSASEFLKTTLLGGLFVLLPVVLLYLLLAEMLDLAIALATPLADLLFGETSGEPESPVLLAIGLIAGASLLLGLLMRSNLSQSAGRWIERRLLRPVPGYDFVKTLIHSLGDTDRVGRFRPVFRKHPDGGLQAAYLIEEGDDGNCTILLSHAPAAMSGPVEIVPRGQLRPTNASFGEFMQSLNHWGTGMQRFLHSPNLVHDKDP